VQGYVRSYEWSEKDGAAVYQPTQTITLPSNLLQGGCGAAPARCRTRAVLPFRLTPACGV
jgi:hypothetical protein